MNNFSNLLYSIIVYFLLVIFLLLFCPDDDDVPQQAALSFQWFVEVWFVQLNEPLGQTVENDFIIIYKLMTWEDRMRLLKITYHICLRKTFFTLLIYVPTLFRQQRDFQYINQIIIPISKFHVQIEPFHRV